MAVELMTRGYSRSDSFSTKMEEKAVQEAATAGLQSVEKLIRLLSQSHQNQQQKLDQNPSISADYTAVADVAVNKFKKFISLLDKNRTDHARFRKGPISSPLPPPKPQQQRLD